MNKPCFETYIITMELKINRNFLGWIERKKKSVLTNEIDKILNISLRSSIFEILA